MLSSTLTRGVAVSEGRSANSTRCSIAVALCALSVAACLLASWRVLPEVWRDAAVVASIAICVVCFRWVNAAVRNARTRGMLLAHSVHQRELRVVSAAFAHELRNRLGVARMNLGYLAERETDERRHAALEDAVLAIDRTLDLSADLLERTTGSGERKPRPVNLADVARTCVRSASMVARDRHVQLTCEGDESIQVMANALDVEYALMNLVLNAVDSSPEGGRVEVRVGRTADEAVIGVLDQGPGVPDDVRSRLFEPFFTTKGSRGTGIGLPLSRAIAESHGGTVRLSRTDDTGSTFEIAIPALDPAGAPAPERSAPRGAAPALR